MKKKCIVLQIQGAGEEAREKKGKGKTSQLRGSK